MPISPDKYFLDAQANQTIQEELTIYARDDIKEETKLFIYTVGMRKIGEENEREFYIPEPDDITELANWIILPEDEITIKPAETKNIQWILNTKNLEPCQTRVAGIAVSTTNPDDKDVSATQIKINSEVISQIHLNNIEDISQDCQQELEIVDFKIKSIINIFAYDNIPFQTRIENSSGVLARAPKGFIEIIGLGVKINIPFNQDNLDIYPNTIRKFENTWIDPDYPREGNFFAKLIYEVTNLRIGRYEARLGITKNVESQLVASTYFWIIPWRIILIILLAFLCAYIVGRYTKTTKLKKSQPK